MGSLCLVWQAGCRAGGGPLAMSYMGAAWLHCLWSRLPIPGASLCVSIPALFTACSSPPAMLFGMLAIYSLQAAHQILPPKMPLPDIQAAVPCHRSACAMPSERRCPYGGGRTAQGDTGSVHQLCLALLYYQFSPNSQEM